MAFSMTAEHSAWYVNITGINRRHDQSSKCIHPDVMSIVE